MIDPVTLAVIQAGLQQVCDEMDLTFSRAAFSPVIAEADDRSDGIYSASDGSLIAQGSKGLPVFVGVMQFSTRTILERIAAGVTALRMANVGNVSTYVESILASSRCSPIRAMISCVPSNFSNSLAAVE